MTGQQISFTNPGSPGTEHAQPEAAVDIANKSVHPAHLGTDPLLIC